MHTTTSPTTRPAPASGRRRRRQRAVVVGLALGVVAAAGAVPAQAGTPDGTAPAAEVQVLAEGLENPFGLSTARAGSLVVAQAGAGTVTRIGRRGRTSTVVRDVPGVAGVASRGRWVWSVIGGSDPEGPPVGGEYGGSAVLRTNLDTGRTVKIADLEDYELAKNPDGQVQLVDGQPVDALTNPFSMALTPRGLLVADGGANDVLRVDPWTGKVSTFFVPPNPTTTECLADGAQSNPGTVGCDSVPTGVAYRGGSVYVSTLGAEQPGAGAIYRLSDRSGRVQRTWGGLDGPTGVAVSNGGVYYSQVFGQQGAGAITRIGNAGRRSVVTVSQPTALLFARRRLHASVGSLTPGQGRVVVVRPRSF